MEGISHEVCSLAGTLGLGKLIAYYDDNGISIDGEVEGWFSDDTEQRFKAYGWQVLRVDGHDADAIRQATVEAKAESNKPTIIICKTIIGLGSPNKQGKEDCHGAPLGKDEIALTREALGGKKTHLLFLKMFMQLGMQKQKVKLLKQLGMNYLLNTKQNIQLKQLNCYVVSMVIYLLNLLHKPMHLLLKQMQKQKQLQLVKQAKILYRHSVHYS
jgi:transketolase